jgi:hypothetical protein
MTYSLSLRPRALAEIEAARDRYKLVGHGDSFVDELDAVFEVITAMPLRFPLAYGGIHRALLRRYPSPCSSASDPKRNTSLCSLSSRSVGRRSTGSGGQRRKLASI